MDTYLGEACAIYKATFVNDESCAKNKYNYICEKSNFDFI